MPQVHSFSTGGYVIHKLKGNFRHHVSAWFDAQDRLIDCEQITPRGSRAIRRNGPMWREIESRGRAYRPTN